MDTVLDANGAAETRLALTRPWRGALLAFAAVCVHVTVVKAAWSLALTAGASALSPEWRAVLAMGLDGAVMLLLAAGVARVLTLPAGSVLPAPLSGRRLLSSGALGAALAAANWLVLKLWFAGAGDTSSIVTAFTEGAASPARLLLGAGLVLFAPFVEEIYYRGMIQGGLEPVSPALGAVAAFLLFVNGHPGSLDSPAMWTLALALGLVRFRTGSVTAAAACHIGNNAFALLLLPLLRRIG